MAIHRSFPLVWQEENQMPKLWREELDTQRKNVIFAAGRLAPNVGGSAAIIST